MNKLKLCIWLQRQQYKKIAAWSNKVLKRRTDSEQVRIFENNSRKGNIVQEQREGKNKITGDKKIISLGF